MWGDDPIGSGGPSIIIPSGLTPNEFASARNIFLPYTGIVYPNLIEQHCSSNDIKTIEKRYRKNKLFKRELKKRYTRAKAENENPDEYEVNEHVWLDVTFKFRDWALEHGYDSFVYRNDKEGRGSDSYVLLREKNILKPVKSYSVDIDKYLSEVPKRLDAHFIEVQKAVTLGKAPNYLLWADL